MDQFFSNVFQPRGSTRGPVNLASAALAPRHISVDVKEHEKQFEIIADLPGCEKKDVSIDIDENVLTLSVEQTTESEDKSPAGAEEMSTESESKPAEEAAESEETEKKKEPEYPRYHRMERTRNFSSRSMRLPDNVVMDSLKAKMDHGVLSITVDKTKPADLPKSRRVLIN